MNTIMLVVLALVGIGAAWLAYFSFSHEPREFLLLSRLDDADRHTRNRRYCHAYTDEPNADDELGNHTSSQSFSRNNEPP